MVPRRVCCSIRRAQHAKRAIAAWRLLNHRAQTTAAVSPQRCAARFAGVKAARGHAALQKLSRNRIASPQNFALPARRVREVVSECEASSHRFENGWRQTTIAK